MDDEIPKPKSKLIPRILLCVVLIAGAGLGYSYYQPFRHPCTKPLEYSIGTVNPNFQLSESDFRSAIAEAEAVWETPTHKNYFDYSPSGKLKVSLIYDSRQQATDKLKSLGFEIDSSKKSFDSLNAQYHEMVSSYQDDKSELDRLIAEYNSEKSSYEAHLRSWNPNTGTQAQYNQLKSEADQVNSLARQINEKKDEINQLVETINASASYLNQLGSSLNLNVATYNKVGASNGTEFEEGVYVSDSSGKKIEIYEFANHDQLVRVLAHEMGHALGLEHVDDPNAIMYKLNQSSNQTPTPADIAELNRVCKF